jgi:hypothetical protein
MVSRPLCPQNPSENPTLKEPAYAPDEDPKQHRAGSFRATPLLNSAERKRPPIGCVFSSVVATLERPIRVSFCRRKNKNKKWPKRASGLSRTASSAGTISTYPRSWAEMDDPARREAILNALTHGSEASWQHVNLLLFGLCLMNQSRCSFQSLFENRMSWYRDYRIVVEPEAPWAVGEFFPLCAHCNSATPLNLAGFGSFRGTITELMGDVGSDANLKSWLCGVNGQR